MALFKDEELCDYIRECHANPHRNSKAMNAIFFNTTEQISVKLVESSAVVGKRQTKHTKRYVVQAATALERELKGGRIHFIDIEEWTHEQEQPKEYTEEEHY